MNCSHMHNVDTQRKIFMWRVPDMTEMYLLRSKLKKQSYKKTTTFRENDFVYKFATIKVGNANKRVFYYTQSQTKQNKHKKTVEHETNFLSPWKKQEET